MKFKMNDLISVVMPVYNVEKYLKRAVDSVTLQTYKNLEIILVDDGSKDSSGKICDEMATLDNRIKVIHQKNSGVSAARNTGIKNANGKYIAFVDPDDVVYNRMYEFLYKAIIENNCKIATCKYETFTKSVPEFDNIYVVKKLEQKEAIQRLLVDKEITSYSWDKLYLKELFENVEFPIGKKYEDLGTIFRLFLKVDGIAYLDMKLYGYFIRNDSITGEYNKNAIIDFSEMIKYRYEILKKEKPELIEYINMNRVNFSTRCFLDIAKHKKISVLKDKSFKKMLYEELKVAKKLNTLDVKKINTKKLNVLNKVLFLSPYAFYYMMRIYFNLQKKGEILNE